VRAVTRAARSLAAGDLAVSLPVRGQDEIGQLTVALNDLSAELQKTDQLRKELIANVSHELKAPLAIIRGYAETVRDVTWPDEAKRTAQLNLIAAEADRLSGLVQDMLGFARLQAGVDTRQPVWLPIRPLMAEVIERYAAAAASLPVSVQIAGSDAVIRFDRGMLIQVLHNLLSNALNHATPGTAVTLSADLAGDSCRISLTNQGETIAAEDLARIWERYRRAESDRSHRALGTGLGLAIVRSILEQHQAVFGVSSADGQTVFWFDVPALDSKQQAGYS
jgi:signal transduction histidine kinase